MRLKYMSKLWTFLCLYIPTVYLLEYPSIQFGKKKKEEEKETGRLA